MVSSVLLTRKPEGCTATRRIEGGRRRTARRESTSMFERGKNLRLGEYRGGSGLLPKGQESESGGGR
jgi:hypothetical protein